jgi:hypothetical protein
MTASDRTELAAAYTRLDENASLLATDSYTQAMIDAMTPLQREAALNELNHAVTPDAIAASAMALLGSSAVAFGFMLGGKTNSNTPAGSSSAGQVANNGTKGRRKEGEDVDEDGRPTPPKQPELLPNPMPSPEPKAPEAVKAPPAEPKKNPEIKALTPEVKKAIVSDAIAAFYEIDGNQGSTNSKEILKKLGGTAKEQEAIRKQIKSLDNDLTNVFGSRKEEVLRNLRDGDGTTLSVDSIKKAIEVEKQNLVTKAKEYYATEITKINSDWSDNPKFKDAMNELARETYNKGVKSGDDYLIKLQADESLSPLEKMKLTQLYIEAIRPVTQYGDKSLLAGLKKEYPLKASATNNTGTDPYVTRTTEEMEADLNIAKDKGAASSGSEVTDSDFNKQLTSHPNIAFYSETGPWHQYGNPDMLNFVHSMANGMPEGQKLYINDMSLPGKVDSKWHKGEAHDKTGLGIDVKMPTKDNSRPLAGNYDAPGQTYDLNKTIELIRESAGKIPAGYSLTVRFNDPAVEKHFRENPVPGLTITPDPKGTVHSNHLHFELGKL